MPAPLVEISAVRQTVFLKKHRMRVTALLLLLSVFVVSALTADEECLKRCSGNREEYTTCCGCCDNRWESCYGNLIKPMCCGLDQGWCGCISSRAFCMGSIYNSTLQAEPFGMCFDYSRTMASCCYAPSPNHWMICPEGTSCCYGFGNNNPITCCRDGETCSPDISTGAARCI